ncbi:hypothetical protein AB0T83_19875, partial [Fluviibacterium sp. DFM31]
LPKDRDLSGRNPGCDAGIGPDAAGRIVARGDAANKGRRGDPSALFSLVDCVGSIGLMNEIGSAAPAARKSDPFSHRHGHDFMHAPPIFVFYWR